MATPQNAMAAAFAEANRRLQDAEMYRRGMERLVVVRYSTRLDFDNLVGYLMDAEFTEDPKFMEVDIQSWTADTDPREARFPLSSYGWTIGVREDDVATIVRPNQENGAVQDVVRDAPGVDTFLHVAEAKEIGRVEAYRPTAQISTAVFGYGLDFLMAITESYGRLNNP